MKNSERSNITTIIILFYSLYLSFDFGVNMTDYQHDWFTCLFLSYFFQIRKVEVERGKTLSQPWPLNSMQQFLWPNKSDTRIFSWTTETSTTSLWSCSEMKECSSWSVSSWRETPHIPCKISVPVLLVFSFDSALYWNIVIIHLS